MIYDVYMACWFVKLTKCSLLRCGKNGQYIVYKILYQNERHEEEIDKYFIYFIYKVHKQILIFKSQMFKFHLFTYSLMCNYLLQWWYRSSNENGLRQLRLKHLDTFSTGFQCCRVISDKRSIVSIKEVWIFTKYKNFWFKILFKHCIDFLNDI